MVLRKVQIIWIAHLKLSFRAVEKVNGFWILVNAQLCQNLLANNDIMHCSELVVVNGIQYDVYSMNECTVRILRRCVLGGGYRGMR